VQLKLYLCALKDIDFDSKPTKLYVREEFTRTKTDRTIFLTEELCGQLKSWLDYKHRARRICDKQHETVTEYRTPDKEALCCSYDCMNMNKPSASGFVTSSDDSSTRSTCAHRPKNNMIGKELQND
jgi:hypothetical protein